MIDSVDFVKTQREERRSTILEADDTISRTEVGDSERLPSESIRPRGQYGLEDFQD